MCGKMAEELLSLKWNNHQAHFVDILTFLREQEIFVDATLACGGKLYAAHKFVLSTCSDYFKQMFTKNPSKHPIVFMKDVTSRDLEALLDFMYNGEVNVPQSSLGSLIKTAEGLQIKGLAVPDDPPAPKRERDRERDKRESKTHLEHLSPPAKRPRPRERSPPHSSPSQPTVSHPLSSHTSTTPSVSRSRSPLPPVPSVGASQVAMPPVEATLDEDSRTSIQSGISGLSEQNSSTTPSLSSKQGSSQPQMNTGEVTSHTDQLPHSHTGEEPSPGPSGLHKPQSKEEPEFEIKQEDVVDLGEDDEGDWGVEGDGGGGDSSVGSENPPNFPEVMLPHTDGSMPPTGDPAMLLGPFSSVAASPLPPLGAPAGHVSLSASHQPGTHSLFGGLGGRLPPSSSPSSSPLMAAAAVAAATSGPMYHHHQHVGRGRYRQDRIRAQMNLVKAETASMESLLDSGMLGALEAEKLEIKIGSKKSEAGRLQKELERLISGQLRQRKFREKMRKKMTATPETV
ncbi:protein tramtrack, beta isoform-like isoform X6 [Homarus americanus]|uniref:Longitudinals lacking protein-like 19 n=1 Tax=Homarus americanus TaxID=6706 RepID=A0A8J5JZJ2_HOMAM|nr:protein tramtrack, beta isoform-like isoform X6 [Homarus americanus]KAG7165446.1 Longitudinals lacking protein-like 19 [Homarus americanus]